MHPTLERAGYQVFELKLKSNQGIDRIAIKYGDNGVPQDILLVESKFSASGRAQLAPGQMGPDWIKGNLLKMQKSGKPELVEMADLVIDNFDKVRLKGNVLDARGVNNWAKLTKKSINCMLIHLGFQSELTQKNLHFQNHKQ